MVETTGPANLPPISARASACEARRSAGDHFQAQEPVYSVVTRPDSEGPALRVVLTSRISTRLKFSTPAASWCVCSYNPAPVASYIP